MRPWGFKSPLAHLATDLFRPRRRRRLFLPIAITVAVIGLIGLSFAADSGQPPSVYAEDLRDVAGQISGKAGTFQEMLNRLSGVGRPELEEVVGEARQTVVDARRFLSDSPPPEPLIRAGLLLDLAAESWDRGLAAFQEALLGAADGMPVGAARNLLTDGLLELRTGDRLYLRAVEEIERSGVPPVSGMPSVEFLPPTYPIAALAGPLVEQAASEASLLRPREDVAVGQVTTDPPLVADTEGALVMEATETMTVRVVVANQGNVESEATTVTLLLEGTDGSVHDAVAQVESLEPGAETTVAFPDLAVTPGVAYRLEVVLGGEPTVIQFRVNEPTPETTTTTSGG
ncbi:MAG: hypothetical protein KatS3mg011_1693 [Acidimicrobiia bacterium]|nr:MAG: hypothetical protein KatS3mg011_1693 [Acidimicrobiia bacterium]